MAQRRHQLREESLHSTPSPHADIASNSLASELFDTTDHVDSSAPRLPYRRDTAVFSNSNTAEDNQNAKDFSWIMSDANSHVENLAHAKAAADANLKQEQQLRIRAEEKVRELTSKVGNLRGKWKLATNQLNSFISQTQGFKQITDEDLKGKALQLRYNIRNFAVQYFSEPHTGHSMRAEFSPDFETYMSLWDKQLLDCEASYPKGVQAYIWDFLKSTVFDRFRWAEGFSSGMDHIWMGFSSKREGESQMSLETIKKQQMWRANTTHLILDHLSDGEMLSYIRKKKGDFIHQIRKALDQYSSSHDGPYEEYIDTILDDAINLDRTISMQAGKISWEWHIVSGEENDEATRLHAGEEVVCCPFMLRRGRSNGEDFNVKSVLLGGNAIIQKYEHHS